MTWEEIRPLLVEAVAVLIAAVVLWRKQHETAKKLDENTQKTEAVPQQTAAAIQDQFKQESATYLLNRFEELMKLHPECQRCLGKIRRDVFDPLRVVRKPDPEKEPPR